MIRTGNIRTDPVQIIHYGSNEMTLQVDSSTPGRLVLSEVWYPGWRATVNGETAVILQADGVFRAVVIPAGVSTVTLRFFAPIFWFWSMFAFGIGLLLLVLLALPTRRPRQERVGSKKIVK